MYFMYMMLGYNTIKTLIIKKQDGLTVRVLGTGTLLCMRRGHESVSELSVSVGCRGSEAIIIP